MYWIWYIFVIVFLIIPAIIFLLTNIIGIILLIIVFGIFYFGYKTHSFIYNEGGKNYEN